MKKFALAVLFSSMILLAAGYASALLPGGPPDFVPWIFAFATASSMISVLALGASRNGRRLGALGWVFGFCFLCIAGGFWAALAAPTVTAASRLWLGLPGGAAIILFLVGLVPMLVLPIAYALTFEKGTLSAEELDRLRAQLAALRKDPAK